MRTSGDPERWISGTEIDEATTITVCDGLSEAEVLDAFGARGEPESLGDLVAEFSIDPWVAVLALGDGTVLAFEDNGWQGSTEPTLRRVSASGSAASVFWNVNAVQALAFARDGSVLSSTRDFGWVPIATGRAAVADAVAGLDFSDWQTRRERGLVAAGRFTGRQIGPADIEAVLAADRAHRILPWLPDHYPSSAGPDGGARRDLAAAMIAPEFAALGALPDDALTGVAWSMAEHVCRETGLLDAEPSAVRTLHGRAITEQAELLARESSLGSGRHADGWAVLHEATNPDGFNAVLQVWSRARYIVREPATALLRAALARR